MKPGDKISKVILAVFFALVVMTASHQAVAQGGTWTTKTPMPSVNAGPMGAVVDDIFYVIKTITVPLPDQALYAYNPVTDQWTTKTAMPTPRNSFGIGVVDGVIYTIGGWAGWWTEAVVEAYNPATDTWITGLAPMPKPRPYFGAGVVEGIIYTIGGYIPGVGVTDTVEAYNPATDTWLTDLTPMPTGRHVYGIGVIDGIIYTVGGADASGNISSKVEAYDPASNTWTEKASLPTARSTLSVEVIDGILYAIGGTTVIDGVQIWLPTVEAYDPATDSWATRTPMPTARQHAAVGVVNGVIYAAGGFNGTEVATLEAFTPQIIDTTPPVIIPTVTPAPNTQGWNNTDVTISWGVSDKESSIASSTGCDTITLTEETAGTTLTCSATNGAGLSNSASVTVKIDKTPPSMHCSVSPNTLWPPNHKMVTVTASVSVTDLLSGPAGFTLTSVTSNEPDEGLGDGDTVNDIQGWAIGTADTVGSLRAERSGHGTGRIYTLIYDGMDAAGNSASSSATVTVPHDKGK
jgi:N-acetylneuraminic acid mutarotase